jgi:hypothetical protein
MANELKHSSVGTTLTQAEFEAVGLHVLDSQATGDLIYASSGTQLSRVAIGAANSILTCNGSVPSWSTAPTVGEINISGTSEVELLNITSTRDDASGGRITFLTASASPAQNDQIGALYFRGKNSGGSTHTYGAQYAYIESPTADHEEGKITWGLYLDGSENTAMQLSAAGALTLDAGLTVGDDITLGANGIKLEETLGTDNTYSGTTCDGVAGATVAHGDLIYLNDADDRWELAEADDETTHGADCMLGIAVSGGNDGDAIVVLLHGFVTDSTAYEFTSGGKPLYISSATAGVITATAPSTASNAVRIVGYAHDDKETIYFNPSSSWVVISA